MAGRVSHYWTRSRENVIVWVGYQHPNGSWTNRHAGRQIVMTVWTAIHPVDEERVQQDHE